MRMMYYSLATQTFSSTPTTGAIAVPGITYQELMDDQRAAVPLQLGPDGRTPLVITQLLTLGGLQAAVAREVKAEAAVILNALAGLGYDATRANNPAVLAAVDAARAYIKGILADPAVLAVQPGTGPGQGAAALKDLIYGKWKAYAASAPSVIKQAFAEVA